MMGLNSSLIEEAGDWTPGSEEGRVGYGSLEFLGGGWGLCCVSPCAGCVYFSPRASSSPASVVR